MILGKAIAGAINRGQIIMHVAKSVFGLKKK